MSSINNSHIFNVDEAGKDQAALETTAAEARIEAPTSQIARQIDTNATKEQEAAAHAASVAKTKGSHLTGEPSTATEQFKDNASRTTNAAVEEGKRDVHDVKSAGAGYAEQAKALANSAIETAQAYLPTSVGGKSTQADNVVNKAGQQGQGILASVEATAGNIYTTVAQAAKPHIERAKEAAQPHVERAKGAAQGYLGTAGVQGAGADSNLKPASEHQIPTSSAPLESGPHTVDSPYPAKGTGAKGTDIAASATGVQPSLHN